MQLKGQSALEFLTAYAFMFLIVAILLVLLLLFALLPKSTLPVSCAFYNQFNCLDSAYYSTSYGSQLVILASNMEPGIVNISNFSASLNYAQSTNGICTPQATTAGQSVLCVANFSVPATIGSVYIATFFMSANYCANAPSGLALKCPSSNTFKYDGNARISASSAAPVFVTYSISQLQSPEGTVFQADGTGYQYNQLPLLRYYVQNSVHDLLYAPVVYNTSTSVYIFNSVSGCGVKTEGATLTATKSCQVTATYNSIKYGNCPQVPNGSGANLLGVVAQYCDLAGYSMQSDNANDANFYGSDMQNANALGANFNSGNLGYTNFANAILSGVNFNNANMIGANLQNATAFPSTNFQGANLEYANMENVNAISTNFKGANMQFVNAQGANFTGATFTSANLAYANLEGANTVGATFSGANIVGCTGCP